jgi:hypothetical protein
VVFKGDLGAELDNAVAVGMIDLNEPMFFRLTNATDKYFFNHQLLGPSDFAPGSPYLDLFNYTISGRLGFYPPPPAGSFNGYSVLFNLQPGLNSTIILLSSGNSFATRVDHSYLETPFDATYTSVTTQGLSPFPLTSEATSFRGVYAHTGSGAVFFSFFPDLNGIWDAPWPDLQNLQPVAVEIVAP